MKLKYKKLHHTLTFVLIFLSTHISAMKEKGNECTPYTPLITTFFINELKECAITSRLKFTLDSAENPLIIADYKSIEYLVTNKKLSNDTIRNKYDIYQPKSDIKSNLLIPKKFKNNYLGINLSEFSEATVNYESKENDKDNLTKEIDANDVRKTLDLLLNNTKNKKQLPLVKENIKNIQPIIFANGHGNHENSTCGLSFENFKLLITQNLKNTNIGAFIYSTCSASARNLVKEIYGKNELPFPIIRQGAMCTITNFYKELFNPDQFCDKIQHMTFEKNNLSEITHALEFLLNGRYSGKINIYHIPMIRWHNKNTFEPCVSPDDSQIILASEEQQKKRKFDEVEGDDEEEKKSHNESCNLIKVTNYVDNIILLNTRYVPKLSIPTIDSALIPCLDEHATYYIESLKLPSENVADLKFITHRAKQSDNKANLIIAIGTLILKNKLSIKNILCFIGNHSDNDQNNSIYVGTNILDKDYALQISNKDGITNTDWEIITEEQNVTRLEANILNKLFLKIKKEARQSRPMETIVDVPRYYTYLVDKLSLEPSYTTSSKKLKTLRWTDENDCRICTILSSNEKDMYGKKTSWHIDDFNQNNVPRYDSDGKEIESGIELKLENDTTPCSLKELEKRYTTIIKELQTGWEKTTLKACPYINTIKSEDTWTLIMKKQTIKNEDTFIRFLARKFNVYDSMHCSYAQQLNNDFIIYIWVENNALEKFNEIFNFKII